MEKQCVKCNTTVLNLCVQQKYCKLTKSRLLLECVFFWINSTIDSF